VNNPVPVNANAGTPHPLVLLEEIWRTAGQKARRGWAAYGVAMAQSLLYLFFIHREPEA
jgi:hypothetical protein